MAHARRKFQDLSADHNSLVADEAPTSFRELYAAGGHEAAIDKQA